MNRTLLAGIGLSTFLFAACADDPSRPSGGGSIQPGEKISGLYVANADNSITRIDLDTGVMRQIELGKEPTRIARIGSRVYVSLRNERAVVVLEENGADLNQIARIETGAEPFGLAATESRVYVAASVGGTVDEYDSKSFELLRSWKVAGEPRWLALHPSNKSLYAASAYGGTLTRIDLESGVASRVGLPRIDSFNFRDGSPITLSARVTGDIAVAPDGKSVWLPMLYVDNMTTIPDIKEGEENPCDFNGMGGPPRDASDPNSGVAVPPGGPGGPGDCGGGYNNQKFNPVATKVPVVESNGAVDANLAPEGIQLVTSVAIQENGTTVGFENINSYPSAVAISGDSKMVFATLEGSAAMVAFPADLPGGSIPMAEAGASRAPNGDVAFPPGGFSFRAIVPVRTGSAPRGIAVIGDKVYVHAFFDRKVEEVELDEIKKFIDYQSTGVFDKALDILNNDGTLQTIVAKNSRTVTTNTMDAEAEAGRRLFYAANNPLMATVGAGVSCATCHFDGRTDGITWHFERGPRATPNLSTKLEDTLPVGWAGNVPTVANEGFSTSQKLMGGTGLTTGHSLQIEKFLYGLREIDSPNKGKTNDAVVRGAAVFANAGCNTCHNGASYTDGKIYTMLGLEAVNPPSLKGVAATAPFFHDGSAAGLEEVIERASKGEMGTRFDLNGSDKADLVEFLKSL